MLNIHFTFFRLINIRTAKLLRIRFSSVLFRCIAIFQFKCRMNWLKSVFLRWTIFCRVKFVCSGIHDYALCVRLTFYRRHTFCFRSQHGFLSALNVSTLSCESVCFRMETAIFSHFEIEITLKCFEQISYEWERKLEKATEKCRSTTWEKKANTTCNHWWRNRAILLLVLSVFEGNLTEYTTFTKVISSRFVVQT